MKAGQRSEVVGNVDLGPTFLELAGLEVPSFMDGESFKSLLTSDTEPSTAVTWRQTYLVEYQSESKLNTDACKHYQSAPNNTFIAMRTISNDANMMYVAGCTAR